MRVSIPLVLATAASLVAAPGAHATFPGDRALLVFQQATDDGLQLFTMPANGGEPLQITHVEPAGRRRARRSPDGTPRVRTGSTRWVADRDDAADGENLRVLPVEAGTGTPGVDLCEGDPSFTPDGRPVVFERYLDDDTGGTAEVSMMALDGTGRTRVTDAGSVDPKDSPDGTRVAFKSNPNGALTVAATAATSGWSCPTRASATRPTGPSTAAGRPVFSEYSEQGPGDVVNIATVAPDGTGLRDLTDMGPRIVRVRGRLLTRWCLDRLPGRPGR